MKEIDRVMAMIAEHPMLLIWAIIMVPAVVLTVIVWRRPLVGSVMLLILTDATISGWYPDGIDSTHRALWFIGCGSVSFVLILLIVIADVTVGRRQREVLPLQQPDHTTTATSPVCRGHSRFPTA